MSGKYGCPICHPERYAKVREAETPAERRVAERDAERLFRTAHG